MLLSLFSTIAARSLNNKLFINSLLSFSTMAQKKLEQVEVTTSMDEKERNTFKSINWWDLNGPVSGLHKMNKVRVSFIRENFALPNADAHLPLKGLQILDVGCGAGILAEPLARLGAKVMGVDPLTQAIQAAEEHCNSMREHNNEDLDISYINADLSSVKNKFIANMDLVILSEVVEHVENWRDLLNEATECVKPGGSIVVTTINRTYTAWLAAIVAAEQILGIIPRGTHEYDKLVKPEEIRNSLTKCNMETRQVVGFSYNPLTRSWSFVPTTAVNYILHAQKLPA